MIFTQFHLFPLLSIIVTLPCHPSHPCETLIDLDWLWLIMLDFDFVRSILQFSHSVTYSQGLLLEMLSHLKTCENLQFTRLLWISDKNVVCCCATRGCCVTWRPLSQHWMLWPHQHLKFWICSKSPASETRSVQGSGKEYINLLIG